MAARRSRIRFAPNLIARGNSLKVEENVPVKNDTQPVIIDDQKEKEKEVVVDTTDSSIEPANKGLKSPLIENDLNVIISGVSPDKSTSPTKSRSRFTKIRPNLGACRRFTPKSGQADEEANLKKIPSSLAKTFVTADDFPPEPVDVHEPTTRIDVVENVVESVSEKSLTVVPKTRTVAKKLCLSERKAGPRRHFNAKTNAPPERSRMTMFDLIYWNPTSNPMADHDEEVQKQVGTIVDTLELNRDDNKDEDDVEIDDDDDSNAMPVPQVKLAADGSIIVDEQSLVIETTAAKKGLDSGQVVHESGSTSTYMSFRKPRNGKFWDADETKKFYKVLNRVGTDFSMMAKFFPKRTRHELKLKFNREDKLNKELVDKAINEPQQFDSDVLEKLIEDEENDDEPAQKKQKTTRGRGRGRGRPRGGSRGRGRGKNASTRGGKRKCIFVSEDESEEEITEEIEEHEVADAFESDDGNNSDSDDVEWTSNKPTRSGRQPKKPTIFTVQTNSRSNKRVSSPAIAICQSPKLDLGHGAGASLVFVPSPKSDLNTQVIHIYRISPLSQSFSVIPTSTSPNKCAPSLPLVLPLCSPMAPGQQFILTPTAVDESEHLPSLGVEMGVSAAENGIC